MSMNNPLAAVLSKIQNAEKVGKREIVTLCNSKMIRQVLEILKTEGYVADVEEITDAKGNALKITLSGMVNDTGVITPNFNVGTDGFVSFEKRYLPSKDFGVLILTTNKGVITHKEAKEQNVGGKLIAFAY
jgi:small subunit ribosomal protein S8